MMKKNVLAAALLLGPTSAMAATFVSAPVVHVAPVHVAPMVRVNPTVKPVVVGHPRPHVHHPKLQPVVVTTVPQKGKCNEPKPGSKECAKK